MPELPRAPLRGSEEMLTGMPCGSDSARACSALLHRAAVPASCTVIIRICRMCSRSMNSFCWSESAYGGSPDAAYGFPPYVPPNGPAGCGGTA